MTDFRKVEGVSVRLVERRFLAACQMAICLSELVQDGAERHQSFIPINLSGREGAVGPVVSGPAPSHPAIRGTRCRSFYPVDMWVLFTLSEQAS